MDVYLPGDSAEVSDCEKVGPGLYIGEAGEVRVSVGGLLKLSSRGHPWVDHSGKKYVPCKSERVIGIVTKVTRQCRVDIGASTLAMLPELAFEGATKRNKPTLQVGDLVFARVSHASCDMEPEISCVEESSGKADLLGPLSPSSHSYLMDCSLGLCRKLLSKNFFVMQALSQHFIFEYVVGMNGRVWINSSHMSTTIAIANALLHSEFLSNEQCIAMTAQILERV